MSWSESAGLPAPLVVRFGRLGDTLLLQPMLHRLHLRYGQPCDLLAVGAWPRPLYDGQPDVGHVYALQASHRGLLLSPERWRMILALRGMRRRPVYVCEPQPRSLAKIQRLLRLAGIPAAHCCYIEDMPRKPLHEADKLLAFAEVTPAAFVGRVGAAPFVDGAPAIQVAADDMEEARHWLQSQGLDPAGVVLLQPANKRTMRWNGVRAPGDDEKSWPVERWAALARGILEIDSGLRVVVCGATVEADYVRSIVAAAADPRVRSAAGALPLRRLLAVESMAHSMISVDTGPAHLAAAVGCPLVVLFGSLPPAQWCPRSAGGSAVTALGGAGKVRRIDELSVEDVLAAWKSLPLCASTAHMDV
ncbi:glycosyltransferase family 9 protein [Frateuria aurantia]